jgi:hypothetical protein
MNTTRVHILQVRLTCMLSFFSKFTVIIFSMSLAFYLDTKGTAIISQDACTGAYAYVGLNLL